MELSNPMARWTSQLDKTQSKLEMANSKLAALQKEASHLRKSVACASGVKYLLSSEFGWRCRVRSRARCWLQLVGCAALLLDASNFGGLDGVGESGIELRRSLRR